MDIQTLCPKCKITVSEIDYYCRHCGVELKAKPLAIDAGKQIRIYLLSFFLPPLGLWPAFKYLKQSEQKAKIIGVLAIILTILSLVSSVYYTRRALDSFNSSLNSQLQMYDSLKR